MWELIALPFKVVFGVLSAAWHMVWGLVSMAFGLVGGLFGLLLNVGIITLVAGLIVAAIRRVKGHKDASPVQDAKEEFASFFDREGSVK